MSTFGTSQVTQCDYCAYEWLDKRLRMSLENSSLCPAASCGSPQSVGHLRAVPLSCLLTAKYKVIER